MKTGTKKGFTLIELILAISLLAIISGGIMLVFDSGINSWLFGQVYSEIQEAAELSMGEIMEGSYKYDGLREVLEITHADETSVSFIPWWEQKINQVVQGQKIFLELPYNPVAPVPIAQIWSAKDEQYELVNVDFRTKGEDLSDDKSYVVFKGDYKSKPPAKIFFYPLYTCDKKIEMTIYWDRDSKQLFRKYRGKTYPLARISEDTEISSFQFEYLNAANSVIPYDSLKNLSYNNNPVSAIRTILTVTKQQESYTLRSFVNIRKKGIAGGGTLLSKGAEILIPSSREVHTLSLINFFGIGPDTKVSCRIYSISENKSYGLNIKFTLKNGIPWIIHYDIEYPRGKTVFSSDPDIPAERGINLLTIDYSGMYDYSINEDIEGQVVFDGNDVKFCVDESTIGGFYLLIR